MTPAKFLLLVLIPTFCSGTVESLYRQHCAICHGARGEGGLGGSLVDGTYQHRKELEDWHEVIRNGLPELGMQGFSGIISEKEIQSLVVYLQELENRAAHQPATTSDQRPIQTKKLTYRLETLLRHTKRLWGVSFLPSGDLIVTEFEGRLLKVDPSTGDIEHLQGTPPVLRFGQAGLLDVAVHPDYTENGWIYLALADGKERSALTAVVRGRLEGSRWVDQEWIYRADPSFRSEKGVHFGTRIVFHDGDIYFAIGDRGTQQQAQDLNRPNGKIHRLREDGTLPPDNPFREQGLPTLWSIGHRNPQALTLRPGTTELWSTEHGPRGGDELNLIQRGKNYGWPTVTYGMNYNGTPITEHTHLPGMEPPVTHWTPSIAVCGMAFVDGRMYPEWEGDLLVGGLRAQVIERLRLEEGRVVEQEVILKNQGRVRDIKTAPDGTLYVILDVEHTSRLVRLIPER